MSGNSKGTVSRTNSTDSGQGSAPLSDAFVAVAAVESTIRDSVARVEAPRSSDRLFVRRSTRVASSRAQSVLGCEGHRNAWQVRVLVFFVFSHNTSGRKKTT